MLKFFALSCLLIQAYAGILPDVPRRIPRTNGAPRLHGRIVGGTAANITDFPYQVALLADFGSIGIFHHACGGSIITESVILTNALCTESTLPRQWLVRAGSTDNTIGGQLANVVRYYIHPLFNIWQYDYDISLFFLWLPLLIDNELTAPIPLPEQESEIADGTSAVVTGWGATEEDGSFQDNLQQVTLSLVNQDVCIAAYAGYKPITDRMFCAGSSGKDACQGDVGGPLAIKGVLIGITSFNDGCAKAGSPGVWTKVSAFRNWIDFNIVNNQ